jgi:hypothetical protein
MNGTLVALTKVRTGEDKSKMVKQVLVRGHRPLAAILFASSVVFSGAQSTPSSSTQNASKATQAPPAQPKASAATPVPVWQGAQANRLSRRAEMYYESVWGVGELRVKAAQSGGLIRFDYRVLDPNKAAALNDKKVEPKLYDAQAGVMLVVPQMDKIGKLRQSSTPKAGMTYWMAFSNPTRVVKPGHHVDVVIGSFRADNLVVE